MLCNFRYEATVLVVLYFFYILIMYFNRFLENKLNHLAKGLLQKFRKTTDTLEKGIVESDEKQPLSGKTLQTIDFYGFCLLYSC